MLKTFVVYNIDDNIVNDAILNDIKDEVKETFDTDADIIMDDKYADSDILLNELNKADKAIVVVIAGIDQFYFETEEDLQIVKDVLEKNAYGYSWANLVLHAKSL